jgi:hypothetical protein
MSKPAFMRESFTRTWLHRKINEDRTLIFAREAENYFGKCLEGSDLAQRNHVAEIVRQLSSYVGQPVISAIPCFALEQPDPAALGNHVNQIGRSGGHVVIFVNAGSRQLEAAAHALCRHLSASLKRCCSTGYFSIVVSIFYHSQSIGRLRKILNDAIVLRALRLGVEDPVIISNDVDCGHTPQGYMTALKCHFSDSCLDILSGPLYYGYAPSGADYLGLAPAVPDLFLGNRVLEARRLCQLRGHFHGARFFSTEGPHTAFRASAYCAAGGYDASLEQAEDDELGIAIFALRQKGRYPFPTRRNAVYSPDFWLVTNPRRQLLAIAHGHSIIDTWRNFPIKKLGGHEISLAGENGRNAISLEELVSLVSCRPLPTGTWTRVIDIFMRGISDQSLSSELFVHYMNACGVSLQRVVEPGSDAAAVAKHAVPNAALKTSIARFASGQLRASLQGAYA